MKILPSYPTKYCVYDNLYCFNVLCFLETQLLKQQFYKLLPMKNMEKVSTK